MMGTNIKEMDKMYSFCKYDPKEKKCMSISYLKHRDTIDTLESNLKVLKEDLKKLKNYDQERKKHLDYLETLKTQAQLEFSKKLRLQRNYAKMYQQVEKETDTTYQEFYDKIDKYMTSLRDYHKKTTIRVLKY